MIKKRVLLASGSPRRSYLLGELDISYRIVISDAEEIIPDGMLQKLVPEYLAKIKGEACMHERQADEVLLAADTIVIHRDEILGKPKGQADAHAIVKRLAGTEHEVITGVYMAGQEKSVSFSVTTKVYLDPLSDDEIEYYIQKYQPMDKAGSYGIQEWIGWAKINHIEGSYSNIMGLPTREVYQALIDF